MYVFINDLSNGLIIFQFLSISSIFQFLCVEFQTIVHFIEQWLEIYCAKKIKLKIFMLPKKLIICSSIFCFLLFEHIGYVSIAFAILLIIEFE